MNSKIVSINPGLTHLVPLSSVTDYEQILTDWLATKRSPHTQRVYRNDIKDFLSHFNGLTLGMFLSGDRFTAFEMVSRYKGELIQSGKKSATLNRRLAAVKSLVSYAYQCGHCEFTLDGVKGEQLTAYRDTRGIDKNEFKRVLETCDLSALKGIRDYALLVLLWSNALRRSEVAKADIKDFDPMGGTLVIIGKGKGSELETVTLGKATITALTQWLKARGETDPNKPLFCSVNPAYAQGRLSTQAIYNVVRERAKEAGINKVMSPHRIRHSSITAALDATGGDVRKVQKLSRHSNLNTLMIYDDNRVNHQGEVTALLDGLL